MGVRPVVVDLDSEEVPLWTRRDRPRLLGQLPRIRKSSVGPWWTRTLGKVSGGPEPSTSSLEDTYTLG